MEPPGSSLPLSAHSSSPACPLPRGSAGGWTHLPPQNSKIKELTVALSGAVSQSSSCCGQRSLPVAPSHAATTSSHLCLAGLGTEERGAIPIPGQIFFFSLIIPRFSGKSSQTAALVSSRREFSSRCCRDDAGLISSCSRGYPPSQHSPTPPCEIGHRFLFLVTTLHLCFFADASFLKALAIEGGL